MFVQTVTWTLCKIWYPTDSCYLKRLLSPCKKLIGSDPLEVPIPTGVWSRISYTLLFSSCWTPSRPSSHLYLVDRFCVFVCLYQNCNTLCPPFVVRTVRRVLFDYSNVIERLLTCWEGLLRCSSSHRIKVLGGIGPNHVCSFVQ